MKTVAVAASGEQFTLPAPVSARIGVSADAPADAFSGTFPLEKSPGVLTSVQAFARDGSLLFDGIVDEQDESFSGGLLLTLRARGRAALLLDSEAMPQSYAYPSLPVLFARHIAPYGFTGYFGGGTVYEGALEVEKGMSEWQAAALFCSRFLGTVPRVRGTVFDASGAVPEGVTVFGPSGVRYASLAVRRRFCDLISEIFYREGDSGAFVSVARDAGAESLGILRKRYLTTPGADAAKLLQNAERRVTEAVLDCAGEPPAVLNAKAEVLDPVLGKLKGLSVVQTDYILDSGGEHCRVTLRG